jgi:DsbC/DsbD-like thiol-disulfide interchange protein/cytochrome c biogenesis protein CcdA
LKFGGNFAKALMTARRAMRKPPSEEPGPKMRYRRLVAVLLHLVALAWAGLAVAQPAPRPNQIAAQLVAESGGAPGSTIELALLMRPAPGWHGYWSNPGDAGLGMQLAWALPPGAKAGSPRYPVPEVLLIQGLMNHVYNAEHAVLVPLTLPPDARPGTRLPIAVDAQWLACTKEICVPERGRLETTVAVLAPGAAAARDVRFDLWRQRLPAPLGAEARFALGGDRLRLALPLPATVRLDAPHLFIGEDKVVDYAAPQSFSRVGDTLIVEIPRAKFAAVTPQAVSGVLRLAAGQGDGLAFAAVPGAVPPPGEPVGAGLGAGSFALLLLGALAGGLLLNVMPCVFPILSLKALSLARAGETAAQAKAEGLAYAAGVILACLGLGGLLLALRAGGAEVGWAFQLQEPLVVAALAALAAALTANFLGVFEFTGPGIEGDGSRRGAFATGLLAAFAATPCTGPFMAAAMGAALLLPALPALALFAMLGLGIALPFVAVAFVPALRRRLPKPGPWMHAFRRWMALPMGLTLLALVWPALLLAWAGRRQRGGLAIGGPLLAGIAALALAGWLALPQTLRAPEAATPGLLAARPFSEAALAEARAGGKPVFVYFTADWCLTCKVNEAAAIEREETRAAFEKAGVTVLVGDWTRRDPAITRFLTAQGVAGVPLYLWYAPDAAAAERLPQVLTAGMLAERAR